MRNAGSCVVSSTPDGHGYDHLLVKMVPRLRAASRRTYFQGGPAQGRISNNPLNSNPPIQLVESTSDKCIISKNKRVADRKHGFERRADLQV